MRSWLPGYLGANLPRRRFLKGMAAGAGAAALIACGGSGGGDSGLKLDDAATARQPGTVWLGKNDWRLADETKEAVRGGIYRDFRTDDVLSHWDPIPQESANAAYGEVVYEYLMHRNRGPGVEPGSIAFQTPVPALAEGWEISADGLRVTFTMRKGVKWQNHPPVNGRVMDLDDWRTTQERWLSVGTYRQQLGQEALVKTEYPDATHMVWHLNAPLAPLFDRIFDQTFAYPILPKELNANPALAELTPIGTGPKMFDKNESSITTEWRKHKDYWGGDPFIDRWHQPIIKEYANRYAQFVEGNTIDFTPNPRDVFQLRRDAPNVVIVAGELDYENACRIRIGKLNPSTFPWKDPRVRIAIKRSIDHKGIGEFLSGKVEFERAGIPVEVEPMTHIQANPAYWLNPEKGELGQWSQNFLFNPAEALKLTAAAGYSQPIHLPYYLSGTGALSDEEQLVTDSLAKSGPFDLERRQVPTSVYRVSINIDAAYDGIQNQSCSAGISNDYVMYRDYHSRGHASGPPAYTDPKIDDFAERQRRELDIEKRNALYKEIQLYWAQAFTLIPGRHRYTIFTARWPWLHNSNYAEGARNSNPDLGLHLHWLDKDMPNRDRSV